MSNRAFGVEIECYAPDGESDGWGNEDGVDYSYDLLCKNRFSHWANLVSNDESLYGDNGGYGVEIKSPVLVAPDGFDELTRVMEILQEKHYFVDRTCGMHVHLNAPEFIENNRLIIKAVKAWKRNQETINSMVDDSRINGNHCPPWEDDDVETLEEYLREGYGPDGTHRGSINVGSLPYHGTIEIRQHEGTLNPEEAIAWIKFCQAFIDTITGGTVSKINNEELLLKRLKVERNASRFLTTKARLKREAQQR